VEEWQTVLVNILSVVNVIRIDLGLYQIINYLEQSLSFSVFFALNTGIIGL